MEQFNEKNQRLVLVLMQQLYQMMKERDMRSNLSLTDALAASDLQIFELYNDGAIRLLTPDPAWGQEVMTPGKLLASLNCSSQWEAPFRAALEQASLGQGGEVEVCTMDEEETWIQLQLEPLSGLGRITAIGTIRTVTEAVQNRHRQEAAHQLLDRVVKNTTVGLEISLEEDTWQLLWGWESQEHLRDQENLSYSQLIQTQFLPSIHFGDQKEFQETMERQALLRDFYTGCTGRNLDYRIKNILSPEYDWRSAELSLFRDAASQQIKCICLMHQVTESRKKQLEEQRQL